MTAGGTALLAVAHGSRDPRHAATVRALTARLRAHAPGARVAFAFLDHNAPTVGAAVDRLAAEGASEVTAVPLLLGNAYHAKVDLPALLRESAVRHPGLTLRQAPVLGPSPLLGAALRRRLAEAGAGSAGDRSTGLLLGWAGSSDPGAVAAVRDLAAGLHGVAGPVATAAAGQAPASVTEAVELLRAAGARRIALARYVIAPGLLPDRLADAARAACAERGLGLTVAQVLGDAPELASLAAARAYSSRPVAAITGSSVPVPVPVGPVPVVPEAADAGAARRERRVSA
ncbi:hypothetical protein BIV57_20935 [Mangrovactinospora gilvigrisea]|uniref:Cobalamin biosynthesis protein CbiX n=1 Tax=Mangrovactinospora gilvigrisea TaxID=1428644 RepID=A0A1J7C1X4_9ACTN|nr:CbiX/SirB N-terminal domain-containing protein [Mangrovactinospora gilvigrisea]OIV35588.1 hypothetical protein BIV57_20935 [Mangrovactinospora gilvigrisea]